ncbi:unnamed protein product [Rhizophagus irregularis]|nr:unnamed protein product [Rhizophagus irregularis]
MSSSKKSKNSLKRFFPSTESMNKKRGRTSLSQEKNQGENQEELSSSSDISDTEQASAKRSHVRKEPNQNWFKIYPWLKKEVEEDKIILFCSLCRERNGKTVFAVGTKKYRLESIKNHVKTAEHKESEDLSKPQQTRIITNFVKQLGIDKLNIISLMRNVYFCAKNHLPINLFPNLCELVTTQIRNREEYITSDKMCILKTPHYEKNKMKASYGSYTNNNSGTEFLSSICNVIEENLFKELDISNYWSLMIDESNTISDDKHLAIVAKYPINNVPYMRYLGMINLEETNALYIFNQIKSFLESKNLNFDSLIHFGSDGASNMTGNLYIYFSLNNLIIKNLINN